MPKRRDENAPYWQQLRFAEKSIIEYALEHGKTIRGTAALLGISPNYLSERTRELAIVTPEVKPGPKPGTKRPPRPELRVVSDSEAPDPVDEVEEVEDDDDEDEVSEDADTDEDEDEEWEDTDEEDEDEDEDDENEDDAASGH